MGENSKISWTHHTFNPWIGCQRVSPGCLNCYAEAFSTRRLGVDWGPKAARRRTAASTWAQPLAWDRKAAKLEERHRVFCASLSDVFEDNPQVVEWRKDLWNLILQTPNLDWLLLTKRPENFMRFFPDAWMGARSFPKNIWLGCTIVNQEEYDEKFPLLRATKERLGATLDFVSFEPLLGYIDMHSGAPIWSIVGGESGFLKNTRKMELSWAKRIMDQAKAQHPGNFVFFKQLGVHLARELKVDDNKGAVGDQPLPYGMEWLRVQEVPKVAVEAKWNALF